MIRCVLLDFDDTIYNFSVAIKNTMFYMIKQSGITRNKAEQFMYDILEYNNELFSDINSKGEDSANYEVDSTFIKSVFDYYSIFCKAMRSYSDKIISKFEFETYFLSECIISNDVIETLKLLKTKGVILIILSDGVLNDKQKILRYFDMEYIFNAIITSDQIACIKPSHNFFNTAQAQYDFNSLECIYIGNHVSDYLMAKHAGIKFYAYNYDKSLARYIQQDNITFLDAFKNILELECYEVQNA